MGHPTGKGSSVPIWSSTDTEVMLRLWSSEDIQNQFKNNQRRHKLVWQTISEVLMTDHHIDRPWDNIRSRVLNCRAKYYDYEKPRQSGDEGGQEKPQFWEFFHKLYGQSHFVNPSFVLDSSADVGEVICDNLQSQKRGPVKVNTKRITRSSEFKKDLSNRCANCCRLLQQEQQQESVREIKIISHDDDDSCQERPTPMTVVQEDLECSVIHSNFTAGLVSSDTPPPPSNTSSSKKEDEKNKVVQVHKALSSIYKLDYLSKLWTHCHPPQDIIVDMPDLNEEISQLCGSCARVLTDLYRSYKEFNRLRQLDSALTTQIDKLDLIVQEIGVSQQEKVNLSKIITNTQQQQQQRTNRSASGKVSRRRLLVKNIVSTEALTKPRGMGLNPRVNLVRLLPSETHKAYSRPDSTTTAGHVSKVDNKNKILATTSSSSSTLDVPHAHHEHNSSIENLSVDVNDDDEMMRDSDLEIKGEAVRSIESGDLDRNDDEVPPVPSKDDDGPPPLPNGLRKRRRRIGKSRNHLSTSTCPICSSPFTANELTGHVMESHVESPNKCPVCHKTVSALNKHLKTHFVDPQLACSMCSLTFLVRNQLECHAQRHWEENGNFQCPHPICPHSTSSSVWSCDSLEEMKKHLQEFHRSYHRCRICGKAHKSASDLQTHSKIEHPGVTPWQCNLCGKYFRSAKGYQKHLIMHETRPFLCPKCELRWSQEEEEFFKSHVETCDGVPRAVCPICRQSFLEHNALYVHLKSHQQAFPFNVFACDLCSDRAFPSEKVLHRHVRDNHTAAGMNVRRPFQCDQCGKAFSGKWKLMNHLRVHTGEKPYLCPICGKNFATAFSLKQHARVHATRTGNDETTSVIMMELQC